jgi:hypothetical protein
MSVRVFYDILNQKGTPAMYTDTFANRPAYGYQGRLFISTDSGQIFEDTGSAWTLVADAGVGGGTLSSVCLNGNTTATGIVITAGGLSTNSLTNTSLTTGSILFADGGGLINQSNATFFWDNTNKRLGIGTASPSAPLDIHATGTNATFNGTGSNNAYLQFQNAGTSKWRIGNTYNGGLNTFDIYNNSLGTSALKFNVSDNNSTFSGSLFVNNGWVALKENIGTASTSTYLTLNASSTGSSIESLLLGLSAGNIMSLNFTTSSNYGYTFPSASGTIALTSDLSSYLPLTGGTLTGALSGTSITGTSLVKSGGTSAQILAADGSVITAGTNITISGGTIASSGGSMAIGGSITSATAGSVLYAGASGVLAQNNANFFWDNTNNRLGLGTASPSYTLDVSGTSRHNGQTTLTGSVTASSALAQGIIATPTLVAAANSDVLVGLDINPTFTNGAFTGVSNYALRVRGTTNTNFFSTGNIGINQSTDAGYKLDVNGTSHLGGRVQIGGGDNYTEITTTASGTVAIQLYRKYINISNGFDNGLTIDAGFGASSIAKINVSGTQPLCINGAGKETVFGLDTATSSTTALVRMESTTKGFLPPRMTTTQRNAISSPATGLVIYDTTLNKLAVYTGSAWETVTSL